MSDCVVNGCIPDMLRRVRRAARLWLPTGMPLREGIEIPAPGESFSGNLLSGCEIDDWLVGRREVTSVQ